MNHFWLYHKFWKRRNSKEGIDVSKINHDFLPKWRKRLSFEEKSFLSIINHKDKHLHCKGPCSMKSTKETKIRLSIHSCLQASITCEPSSPILWIIDLQILMNRRGHVCCFYPMFESCFLKIFLKSFRKHGISSVH